MSATPSARGRASRGSYGAALVILLTMGALLPARAAETELPSKELLEFLGTIEAEGDDWTIFDSDRAPGARKDPPRTPSEAEKSPPPPTGDES